MRLGNLINLDLAQTKAKHKCLLGTHTPIYKTEITQKYLFTYFTEFPTYGFTQLTRKFCCIE